MPTNLTDADLAAIEARHTTTLDNGERVIDEDTAHLLAAVREARTERDEARCHAERADSRAENAIAARRVTLAQRDEARALVEALLDAGDWYHGHGDHLEGYIDVCYPCGVVDGHDPVCPVGRAEDAIARWKGASNPPA